MVIYIANQPQNAETISESGLKVPITMYKRDLLSQSTVRKTGTFVTHSS